MGKIPVKFRKGYKKYLGLRRHEAKIDEAKRIIESYSKKNHLVFEDALLKELEAEVPATEFTKLETKDQPNTSTAGNEGAKQKNTKPQTKDQPKISAAGNKGANEKNTVPETKGRPKTSAAGSEGAKEKNTEAETKDRPKTLAAGKEGAKRKNKLKGLICMCNTATKPDCFKYRVFGLPEAKKDLVEKIHPKTKLFLYDFDLKVLYGIYEPASQGGLNLVPEAFKQADGRRFPAQVRFRIQKDCLPIPENVFRLAIEDNYIDKSRFSSELTMKQVNFLCQLFRPVPHGDTGTGEPERLPLAIDTGNEPSAKPGFKGERIPDRRPLPYSEKIVYRGIQEYQPPQSLAYNVDPLAYESEHRRLEQARDASLIPGDLYFPRAKEELHSTYSRPFARAMPEVPEIPRTLVNPNTELDALYRQRLQLYSDPLLSIAPLVDTQIRQGGITAEALHKRTLEEAFMNERAAVSKRPNLQDELGAVRELQYQRAAPIDQRLLSNYHAGSQW